MPPVVITPEDHRAAWETAHPVPNFEIPVGWHENRSMRNHNGSQMSLRSENWRYHIDLNGVPELATVEGPYWSELRVQVGGDASFETHSIYRLTGIEPGGVQDAVYLLVGKAVEHELERERHD